MIAKKVIAMQIVWEEEQEIIHQCFQIHNNKQKWLVLRSHFGWNKYLSASGVPNKQTCAIIKSGKKSSLYIYQISTLHCTGSIKVIETGIILSIEQVAAVMFME